MMNWFSMWGFGLGAGILALPFMIVGILLFAFWIWMIVDAAQRKFRNDVEKIIWIVVIVLGQWIGALVYYIVVRTYNPKGVSKK